MIEKFLRERALAFTMLLSAILVNGQDTYEFNREGNTCHFMYINYAPDGNYDYNKPIIVQMGQYGDTPFETFQKDTIKDLLAFYKYSFIYLPNNDSELWGKLQCLSSFMSMATRGQPYGHGNLFLFINDSTVENEDLSILLDDSRYKRLASMFNTIRIGSRNHRDTTGAITTDITQDFEEDRSVYEAAFDEYESYYVEEELVKKDKNAKGYVKPKKIYFGKPAKFDFTLSGSIRDNATGEALPFAIVRIKGSNTAVSSNVDGFYALPKVPTDTTTLVVSYVGYGETEIFLTPETPTKNFVIELSSSTNLLDEVVVQVAREDVVLAKKEDVSVIKMTPKKLKQLPSMGERDVMRSLQLMPGVSAANESSSGLYVRGGTPDQNLVLYDGFTVYHVDHLYGFFSAFNSNALKDVQLYKGGFESKYGGRLSSVTDMTGKTGNQKRPNAGIDISLLSLNAYVEVPVGEKFSSIVAYRRSYKGFLYDKIFDKFNTNTSQSQGPDGGGGPGGRQFQNTTVSSFFYDLNGKFTYKPTDKDIISLSVFNSSDKLDNSTSFEAPDFGGASTSGLSFSSTDLTKYGNIGSSLKWSRRLSEKLYSNTIVSYSNYYSDRDRSQERTTTNDDGGENSFSNGVFENNDLKDYSAKTDFEWNLFNFSKLQFGGFATYFDIDYTYAQSDTANILDKKNRALLSGGYLQNKFTFYKNRIHFLPGVRISHFEITNLLYYEPRASLSFLLTDKITLKGAAGKYYQFANRVTREDILSGSKDFWLLSDGISVPVSSANHYISGISYENNKFLFSTEMYYKELDNLTEYSLRFDPSPSGITYDENFFTGKSYARGIEFLLQKKTGKINGWVSYTLAEAKNYFDTYSDDYYPANQDVTHEFKSVLMYRYKRWDFSATWVYATGRPYTAPSGAYNIALLDGSDQEYFTVTSKNGVRLPDYHRADISANYKILAGEAGEKRRGEIGYIGFSLFNLYNRTNTWYKQYTIEDSEIIETNVNYLGITPNITLSLKLK